MSKRITTWNPEKGYVPQNVGATICAYGGVLVANQLKKAFPKVPVPKKCVQKMYEDKDEQLQLNEWADMVLNMKTKMHQTGHKYFKSMEGSIIFPWYLWEYPISAMFTTNQDTTLGDMFHHVVKKYNKLRKNSSPDPEDVDDLWYCEETFCARFVDCLMAICGGYFGFVETVKVRAVDSSQVIRINSTLFSSVITIEITEKTVPNFEASEIFMKHFDAESYEYLGASVKG